MARRRLTDKEIDRELDRAKEKFGGVKSWELTPDGGLIVLPITDIGAPDAGGSGQDDELAKMRARRDARQHQGAGVSDKASR